MLPTSEPNVASIMTTKPYVIEPDTRFDTALRLMTARGIRHLPVVNEGRVVGVVSHRDLLAVRDPSARACDFMTEKTLVVHPDAPAYQAARALLTLKLGCLPVVDGDDRLVGIVTEADFVRVAYAVLAAVSPSARGAEARAAADGNVRAQVAPRPRARKPLGRRRRNG